MSLAFALMAAINGSTGSCATLSYGLQLQHQASPTSARRPEDSHPSGVATQAPPRTLSCESETGGGKMCTSVPLLRWSTRT